MSYWNAPSDRDWLDDPNPIVCNNNGCRREAVCPWCEECHEHCSGECIETIHLLCDEIDAQAARDHERGLS